MKNDKKDAKIIQICHGRIIPAYSSAYALRCNRYLNRFSDRMAFSVGGLIFKDETNKHAKQFRSIIMTGLAFLKGGRSLEILLSKGKFLRKKYMHELQESLLSSDVVIFEGPWQFRLFKHHIQNKLIIYDAHNVESSLRTGNEWEKYTFEIEKELSEKASLILTVSEEDKEQFLSIYNTPSEKIKVIPEGFEAPEKTWENTSKDIVFIGSAYGPNIEAANQVIKIAEKLPQYSFKIIGSVCNSIPRRKPSNVKCLGMLNNESKEREICSSYLALNPVNVGSGRNLKMNDYISHGIPTITTEIGARGFCEELKRNFFIAEIKEFPEKIIEISSMYSELSQRSKAMIDYAKSNSYENTIINSYNAIINLLK